MNKSHDFIMNKSHDFLMNESHDFLMNKSHDFIMNENERQNLIMNETHYYHKSTCQYIVTCVLCYYNSQDLDKILY
jgi:hypothetical protein